MIFFLSLSILALTVNIFLLMKKILLLQDLAKVSTEKIFDLEGKMWESQALLSEKISSYHKSLQEMLEKSQSTPTPEEKPAVAKSKQPPANRNPRTEAHKEAVRQKKKEWWRKKREEEAARAAASSALATKLEPSPGVLNA